MQVFNENPLFVLKLVGRPGFEPGLTGSEPVVLPLDDLPIVSESTFEVFLAFKINLDPLNLRENSHLVK